MSIPVELAAVVVALKDSCAAQPLPPFRRRTMLVKQAQERQL